MKKVFMMVALAGMVGVLSAGVARAGEVDQLVGKLVEKGVLTPSEAQILLHETQADVAKQNAKAENSSLPKWIQTMKMKGDFRLRYQYDHAKATENEQHRARVRLRFGVETNINDKVLVGLGLATGTTDVTNKDAARSTNQTLGDSFSKKGIALDYAFVQYSPATWAALVAGKFKNPLWEPGDMIWDTDINPEGAGAQFKYGLDSKTSLFMNAGVFVLDESSSSGKNDDPMMYVVQPGVTYQLSDDVNIKGAFSYYNCANVKGTALDGDTNTNSQTGGVLQNSYRWISPAVEVNFNNPLGFLGEGFPVKLPYLGLFTEYVSNIALDDNEAGQMFGLKFGDAKVDGWKKWQFKYSFTRLENDAVLDILPDSDRYGGKTGIRGHEGVLEFGLGKNVTLALDYYYAQALAEKSSQQPAHVFQADFNFKF